MKKEALFYQTIEEHKVRCHLCSHGCIIKEGEWGLCGVRKNTNGRLYTYNYANPIAIHIDPIEKKPLYHFFPGSFSLSVACLGCNFRCGFCQNWQISQVSYRAEEEKLDAAEKVDAEELVKAAKEQGCKSISYTYTEPTIFFEYALATARLAKEEGIYNNFVSNGYMSSQAIHAISAYLDAANIDLKFFRDSSYRKFCGGRLKPVLDSIGLLYKLGVWVEVTTLIIPGENDSQEELQDIASFLAGISPDIAWHVSRFHPDYKFTAYSPTPEKTLRQAQEIGYNKGLHYVYVGNVAGWGNDTSCPHCRRIVIKREIFSILEYNIKNGCCGFCGGVIAGRFD